MRVKVKLGTVLAGITAIGIAYWQDAVWTLPIIVILIQISGMVEEIKDAD